MRRSLASSLHYCISLSLSRLSVIFCSLLFNHPFGDVENEKKKQKQKQISNRINMKWKNTLHKRVEYFCSVRREHLRKECIFDRNHSIIIPPRKNGLKSIVLWGLGICFDNIITFLNESNLFVIHSVNIIFFIILLSPAKYIENS